MGESSERIDHVVQTALSTPSESAESPTAIARLHSRHCAILENPLPRLHAASRSIPCSAAPSEKDFMRISTRLSQIELLEINAGKPVALGSLWADKPSVLIFLRHFG